MSSSESDSASPYSSSSENDIIVPIREPEKKKSRTVSHTVHKKKSHEEVSEDEDTIRHEKKHHSKHDKKESKHDKGKHGKKKDVKRKAKKSSEPVEKKVLCTLGDMSGITVDPTTERVGHCFSCYNRYKDSDEPEKCHTHMDETKPIQLTLAKNNTYRLVGFCFRDGRKICRSVAKSAVKFPADPAAAPVAGVVPDTAVPIVEPPQALQPPTPPAAQEVPTVVLTSA